MTDAGFDAVNASVINRFKSGSALSQRNAEKIGEFLGFNPLALLNDGVATLEAQRLGLLKPAEHHPDTLSDFLPFTGFTYSVRNHDLAPVFEWARLGEVLYKENDDLAAGEHQPRPPGASERVKWFTIDSDMPHLAAWAGWKLAFDPIEDDSTCKEMRPYLFETASSSFFVGQFRRLANGYEAIPYSGPPMDSTRHGIRVVAEYCGSMK